MRAPVATLVLLSLLTFIVGLGRQAITDGDEGYYAEASREMVESGDWLTPHFNYTDRWQKPILYYWVTAATFLATGTSEWGARSFSAVSGVLLVLLTCAVGRKMLDQPDAAYVGAAITATCAGYFALARLALPDLPLALFVTLTVFLWLQGRPRLSGLAAALGFLDKGPLALAIPVIVLLPIAWRESRWRSSDSPPPVSLRLVDLTRAAIVFLVVATPWYTAMVAEHGRAYLESFFIGDNLERFATDRFNSPRALWFYVPIVIGGVFPWTAYLLVLPWRRTLDVLKRKASLSANEWRLIIWMVAPLLFFTVSIGKQPRYILPVLPPLALLIGASIWRRVRPSSSTRNNGTHGLAVATWLTALVYFVLAALILRARPVLITAYPAATLVGVAALTRGGIGSRLDRGPVAVDGAADADVAHRRYRARRRFSLAPWPESDPNRRKLPPTSSVRIVRTRSGRRFTRC